MLQTERKKETLDFYRNAGYNHSYTTADPTASYRQIITCHPDLVSSRYDGPQNNKGEVIAMGENKFEIRFANEADVPLILALIRELADYEHMLDEVVATEEILREWIFEKKKAEVLIGEENGTPVGFALFFHNFSTFLGRAGIYLEDLFVRPEYRGRKYGKSLLKRLAEITVERKCGRLDWCCLDWNEPSIAFYRSLGAIPLEDWTIYRLSGETLEQFSKSDC